ncbi:hypothetical protein [Thiomonas sp. X19]|uniref:hypothetical protein n=1 Tax=Thiomonas sp. X19 TaxID=1050370 RepID=UPI000DDB0276|nr:hypothetical protein [Thiomonas sp. X19]
MIYIELEITSEGLAMATVEHYQRPGACGYRAAHVLPPHLAEASKQIGDFLLADYSKRAHCPELGYSSGDGEDNSGEGAAA